MDFVTKMSARRNASRDLRTDKTETQLITLITDAGLDALLELVTHFDRCQMHSSDKTCSLERLIWKIFFYAPTFQGIDC